MAVNDMLSSGLSAIGLNKIGSLGLIGTVVLWLVGAFFVCGIIIFIIILVTFYFTYNQKVRVFGMVGGNPQEKYNTKGKFIRVGRAGDMLLQVKAPQSLISFKPYRTLPYPTIQSGSRTWYFWERSDGEWINFRLKNLDEIMREAGAHFIHQDMRMQRLAIESLLRERMTKQSFWQKYGPALLSLGYMLVITVLLIVIFYQWGKIAPEITSAMKAVAEVTEDLKIIRGASPQRPSSGEVLSWMPLLSIKILRRKKWQAQLN